jgi:hypothetical protein
MDLRTESWRFVVNIPQIYSFAAISVYCGIQADISPFNIARPKVFNQLDA